MKQEERKLTLCRWTQDYPYVLLKGRWFRDYGFSPGDQVIVSNPEPHTLLMTINKPEEKEIKNS